MMALQRPNTPVTVSLDVVWQGRSGKQGARMSEISMDDCFIDSRVQGRSLGDIVDFKVHLPSGPWVALRGELVNEDYPIGFGLRFTDLTEADKILLAEVVVEHGGDPGALEPAPAPVEIQIPAEVSVAPQRVLVADDDPLTLRMVGAIIESEGYQAVSAVDGQQALELLQADNEFSAAIFDMTMPHFKGLDLILYMKANERLRGIPVGMITAERDPKVWDDSVAAGASVFLPKPFTPPQVQMMLRMLTSKAA
jgi:CheY-like chemotaxis protein